MRTGRLICEDVAALDRGDTDTVELKLPVPESDRRSSAAALELDPLDAQIRQVFSSNMPDPVFYRAGVVARARRVKRFRPSPIAPSAARSAARTVMLEIGDR